MVRSIAHLLILAAALLVGGACQLVNPAFVECNADMAVRCDRFEGYVCDVEAGHCVAEQTGDDDAGDDDSGDDDTGDDDTVGDDDSAGDDDSTSTPPVDIVAQGITMIVLSGGTFQMGCTLGQSSCGSEENPAHSVTLTKDFWISKTEVTQGQWQALMGNNPSYFSANGGGVECGGECPVEEVNWYEALEFANVLSALEGLSACYVLDGCTGVLGAGCPSGPNCPSGNYTCSSVLVTSASGSPYHCEGYRLPTEAEWEYAARAGSDLLYAGSSTVDDVSWYLDNSGGVTHSVATKDPNGWGLHDMSGNVLEWTWDGFDSAYYGASPASDPEGPSGLTSAALRGGWKGGEASWSRVSSRHENPRVVRNDDFGFRLSRTIP